MSNESLHILVDKEARRSKSLMILQRYYSNVVEIKDDTVHTAVYNFNLMTSGWEKLGIEGGLFITRNKTAPLYSAVVLNKTNPENFELSLDMVISVNCQAPFIMLRYETKKAPAIAGLWIHDVDERNKMLAAIENCLELAKKERGLVPRRRPTN